MRITQLTIRNFKRFKSETVISLDPITVLIGGNNSGKSSVLQALCLFQDCVDLTRTKKNGDVTLEPKTRSPEEFAPLPLRDPNDLWPDGKTKGAVHVAADFENGAHIGFEVKISFNRFSITPTTSGDIAPALDATRLRYVPIHSGLALREEYLLMPARTDRLRQWQHGTVIRNLLWDLKHNESKRWGELKDILQRLYPEAELDVQFDETVDRYIVSEYGDEALKSELDIVVAGTGFQQALQIFSSVLAQKCTTVLLDEPDAHLHARLQVEMLRIFGDLTQKDGMQFIIATHSPHLISNAPAGSLRAMINGKAHPFAEQPEQIDLLDSLGAFDRMEVLALLRTKAAVFVENRDDRNYLEMFARKKWGQAMAQKVWEGLSFLYTYQDPITAKVHLFARQINDLLSTNGLRMLHGGQLPRYLVIGDRDYRSADSVTGQRKGLLKKAKEMHLQLRCEVWERNEIENYLLDLKAIEKAVVLRLQDTAQKTDAKTTVRTAWNEAMTAQRGLATDRVAERLQQDDPEMRSQFIKAKEAAQALIDKEWADGSPLADAKKVLSAIRGALQSKGIRTRLNEADIVECMEAVPPAVAKVLVQMQHHGGVRIRKRRSSKPSAGGKHGEAQVSPTAQ